MIEYLFSNPAFFLIWAISLIIAVTVHEFSHAFIADRLGDPTPKIMGRVTLNPLAHLDPIGTLAILIANFGWGKPVQYDPYNLQNPKKDSLLISLAGPGSNLILAILASILIKTLLPQFSIFLVPFLSINVGLAIFNLLPVPPLDGSKILAGILPTSSSIQWEIFSRQNSNILLFFFILPLFAGRSLASVIISPIIGTILNILL
jgi:Zn-dependent protease